MEQLYELEREIPHPNVATDLTNENSDFSHQAGHMKNCYLMFHTSLAEDCYYGYGVKEAKSCIDGYYNHKSEFCYECVDVKECSNLAWCQTCQNCRESQFLHDCIGCDHCFLCHGLRNKQYCIMNEQLTPEEYKKRLDQLDIQKASQADDIRAKLQAFTKKFPQRENKNIMHENVYGNYLYQAKDTFFSYDCSDIEACRYCTQLQLGSKYCYDMYQFGINIDHCYEMTQSGYNISNCLFGYELIENCTDMYYCLNSYSSRNCFASYGLNKNQFCILNKQYEEQEYYDLLEKCIQKMQDDGEWGEFFDPRHAPIPYNDSTANVWYPMSEQQAKEK